MAFSPDGRRLASSGADGRAIVYELDPRALVEEACHTANRNLSCAEWRQHLGARAAYRPNCPALPLPTEACRP